MSTTTTSRRQLRLPGQAAAPRGPVDMTVMYLMHHAFRRDLARVRRGGAQRRRSRTATPGVPSASRWEHFAAVLHHHHTGEDTWLWPFLLERADRGGAAPRWPRWRPSTRTSTRCSTRAPPGSPGSPTTPTRTREPRSRSGSARSARRLGRHLAHEETDTIALLQRVMTQEEWEEIDKEFAKGVTLPFLLRTLPWVMHEVPFEAREHAFASSGPAHRVMWRLTRPRFERLQARAFRYAP